jgi:hypothetical protein
MSDPAIGQLVSDLLLRTADGGELALGALRGQPVVAICVRYYG